MPRKILLVSVPILSLFLFYLSILPVYAVSNKTYTATTYTVKSQISTGGSMTVTETIGFQFSGGSFTFVSRDLPTDNTDGVSILSAAMDNESMSQGSHTGQYEISGTNPINIKWHFNAQPDTFHTFTLSYKMNGVIQQNDHEDLLDWRPLPTKHDYTIQTAKVEIDYPASTSLNSTPEIAEGSAQERHSTNAEIFSSSNLGKDDHLELGLRFKRGSLVSQAPAWQQKHDLEQKILPYSLGGGGLIFIIGSWLYISRYRRYRRKTNLATLAALQVTAPPTQLPPAIAGAIATSNDGSVSWDQALGVLFNLMDRGVVTVTPPLTGWSGWFDKKPDFQLMLINLPPDLTLYEAGLLKVIFDSGNRPTVNISKVGDYYRSNARWFGEPLRAELTAMGLFDTWRQRIRKRLGCTGALMLVLAGLAAVVIPFVTLWPLLFLALGIVGVSITVIVLWSSFSTYNDEAFQVAQSWKAFVEFMKKAANTNAGSVLQADFVVNNLAYAASFGLLVPWAKTMQRLGAIALPHWFRHLAAGANVSEQDATHGFLAMATATHETGHKSESSSGSSGSSVSGSAGAAGGGSSSAG